MALGFDWSLFQQSADKKNQNRLQSLQDLSGIGQSLGAGVQGVAQMKNQQNIKNIISKMISGQQGQGQAPGSPVTAGVGGVQAPSHPTYGGMDPMMQSLLQIYAMDPSQNTGVLSALAKGEFRKNTKGLTPEQEWEHQFKVSQSGQRQKNFDQLLGLKDQYLALAKKARAMGDKKSAAELELKAQSLTGILTNLSSNITGQPTPQDIVDKFEGGSSLDFSGFDQ